MTPYCASSKTKQSFARDELIWQKVKNIIPECFAEQLISDGTRSAAEAIAQQIGMGIELSGRRKDGSEFPIEIMLSPLKRRARQTDDRRRYVGHRDKIGGFN